MSVHEPNEFDELKTDTDLNFIKKFPEVEEAIGIDEILKWLED
ncbi:hypothetical protein [Gottfriedia luciferensis]|nr:hypothetical protein [Gottfriedia luciferensis]